jgi:hypothetical protein
MNLNDYLKNKIKNINEDDICHMNILEYNDFKQFVDEHYNLNHLKNNNYLKYVKVVRQKIVYTNEEKYEDLIDEINAIFKKMHEKNLFYKLNFRRYLFNIKKIIFLLQKRELGLNDEIKRFNELYHFFPSQIVKFKLLQTINTTSNKLIQFKKYKHKLVYLINKFKDLELKYDIDQDLININNNERTLIGKKSEYNVKKILKEYIKELNKMNEMNKDIEYIEYIYYENVDIFKLFNVKLNNNKNCKGEIDGLILKKEKNDYIIEYIIEVKSSIKATYEDINKIMGLKQFFINYEFTQNKQINEEIVLNEKSFEKIINNKIHEWLIYICNDNKNNIDKTHFYFSYVLKIIDYDFIIDYYVNKCENSIIKKHKKIVDNQDYVEQIYEIWKKHVYLTKEQSCIYIIQ